MGCYYIKDDVLAKAELKYGFGEKGLDDKYISFGFEKRFGGGLRKRPAQEPKMEVMEDAVVTINIVEQLPKVKVIASFRAPSLIYSYLEEKPYVIDINKHWGRNDMERMLELGLMSTFYDNTFKPKDTMRTIDATKLVIKTVYLHRLLEKTRAKIRFRIAGQKEETYLVNLKIRDFEGKEVLSILNNEKFFPGNYEAIWDGMTNANKKAPEGTYKIEFNVYKNGVLVDEARSSIVLKEFSKPEFSKTSSTLAFENPIEKDWAEQVIQESIKLGLLDLNLALNPDMADQRSQRLEFITQIAKGLRILGAPEAETPELWLYRDMQNIPSYLLNHLNIYVSELGYGGDKTTSLLRPFEDIKRVEVAIILNRFMNWHLKEDPSVDIPVLELENNNN